MILQDRAPLLTDCPDSVFMDILWSEGFNSSLLDNNFSGRKYQVYSEVESEPLCDSSGAISTFTFLNFLAASVSLAGNLGSNTNSNNNNNNDNNNDNNNNDNNINIGNNNNNVNSANTLMFLPMIGKR